MMLERDPEYDPLADPYWRCHTQAERDAQDLAEADEQARLETMQVMQNEIQRMRKGQSCH